MMGHRSSLIMTLQSDEKLCDTVKAKLLTAGDRLRLFDDIPDLLPTNTIINLAEEFNAIIQQIDVDDIGQQDGDLTLVTLSDKRNIFLWERKIIRLACHELLNLQRGLKQELLQLLQQRSPLNATAVYQIVCAYVGAINQAVMGECAHKPVATLPVALNFITRHYGQWITEELKPVSSPTSNVILGVGLFTLAGAVAAGITLFASAITEEEEPKNQDGLFAGQKNQF